MDVPDLPICQGLAVLTNVNLLVLTCYRPVIFFKWSRMNRNRLRPVVDHSCQLTSALGTLTPCPAPVQFSRLTSLPPSLSPSSSLL